MVVRRKDNKPVLAGKALVAKRIDEAVKRAERKAARPKRPSAARLLQKAKLLYGPEGQGTSQMVNQTGQEVFEEDVFTPSWCTNVTGEEVQETISLILGHLNLKVVKTNATKHGTTELELRPYP